MAMDKGESKATAVYCEKVKKFYNTAVEEEWDGGVLRRGNMYKGVIKSPN